MEMFFLRALERLLIVAVGGLSIYLGYRLFANIKAEGEGSAEVKLPGNVTLMVSRVGPGVFFALFGALVVGASLSFPVTYSEHSLQTAQGVDHTSRSIIGIGPGKRLDQGEQQTSTGSPQQSMTPSLELERLRIREQIAFLNQLPALLDPELPKQRLQRVNERILAGKLQLMKSVWGPDWGDFEPFRLWAEGGAKADTSAPFLRARSFFDHGQADQP